jgi:hypothetical protein
VHISDFEIQLEILPNPTPGNPIIVHNLPENEDFTFVLHDATGRKLIELNHPSSPFTLNTDQLSGGNYWLSCEFEGTRISKRFVKL